MSHCRFVKYRLAAALFVYFRGSREYLEARHSDFHVKRVFDHQVIFNAINDVYFKWSREKIVSHRMWQGLVGIGPQEFLVDVKLNLSSFFSKTKTLAKDLLKLFL